MHIKRKAKVNISKKMYDQIVDDIEHEPLIKHSTLAGAGVLSVIAVLLGLLLWYAPNHPAKLVKTSGTVASVNSGRTDNKGTVTTFTTFEFTANGAARSVKQPVTNGVDYKGGEKIVVGYSPLNPNYARNLSGITPPVASYILWAAIPAVFFWFGVVALARHHERQLEIWAAAEAADVEV